MGKERRNQTEEVSGNLALTRQHDVWGNRFSVIEGGRDASLTQVPKLGRFIIESCRKLQTTLQLNVSEQDLAILFDSIVLELFRRVSGYRDLRTGIGPVVHHLWGAGPELKALISVALWAKKILGKSEIRSESCEDLPNNRRALDCQVFVTELQAILHWYGRRELSLLILEEEGHSKINAVQLFGFRVLPDRMFGGESGVEIVTGIMLQGVVDNSLRLKLFFADGTRTVSTTSDWTDVEHSHGNFNSLCAVTPFVPLSQRQIIDEARLFVPYSAFDLDIGRQTIQVECVVTNSLGQELASKREIVTFLMPVCERHAPCAPQAANLWIRDITTGTSLSKIFLTIDEDSLVCFFDICLVNCQDEKITLNAYFVDRLGLRVSHDELKRTFISPCTFTFMHHQKFRLSLQDCDSSIGDLFLEVVLSDGTGKILCGVRENVF